MVIRSRFDIKLVYADTLDPFEEFEKDGKMYVEAEPRADYFISIRRVNLAGPKVMISQYTVDDKSLGYICRFHNGQGTKYHGIARRVNGQE